MQMINDDRQRNAGAAYPWHAGRREVTAPQDTSQVLSRLDFRHLSSHISQRRAGYYLILLRNELRHRSLREKPGLTE